MCLFIMPRWFLPLVLCFFLIILISYLLLFLKCDRSPVLNCRSDLTPTQALKSTEAAVGMWTTSGIMGIFFTIFFILFFFSFSFSTITNFLWFFSSTQPFFHLCHPLFSALFFFLPCVPLSVSPFPLTLLIDMSG